MGDEDQVSTKGLEFKHPEDIDGEWKTENCNSCHEAQAWGEKDGTYPNLAGQHYNVQLKQLADTKQAFEDNKVNNRSALLQMVRQT